MRSSPNQLYRLAHKDYFERFDAYCPTSQDFYDIVIAQLDAGWGIHRTGIWFQCNLPQNAMPLQGWKIHVSATPRNAQEILKRVTGVLAAAKDTNFKFALDLPTLCLINGKEWSRAGSGKFITIYPPSNNRFLELIEELHSETREFSGPYILSDYRYRDSGVVFYRYGGMQLYEVLNVEGERTPMLISPDGSWVPDQRSVYPVTPPWADILLPTEDAHSSSTEATDLKEGRYTIEEAISFSNSGGVYRALDNETGKKVIVKEARPGINDDRSGYDAVHLLKKEYSILKALSGTGIAPQPIDIFQEWEHWFLVEEFLDGISISRHCASTNILLRTRATEKECADWYSGFCSLCLNLISIIDTLHQHDIIFSDLSPTNLIVCRDTAKIKLIDFEGAYQLGIDPPTKIHTPGYTSPSCSVGEIASFDDDLYAVGAVLFSYILPVNGLLELNPDAAEVIMQCIRRDMGLPKEMVSLILDLMSKSPEMRRTPAEVFERVTICDRLDAPEDFKAEADYRQVLDDVMAHIEATATYDRSDRLFPGDAKLFTTNPLSVAYGAAGVAYALEKIKGKVPTATIDWMLGHTLSRQTYTPGLYIGLSGIAWTLLELGLLSDAEKTFKLSISHPLLHGSADLMYGMAGWGMTCLRFFIETGDQMYLDQAVEAGGHLLKSRQQNHRGCYWECGRPLRLGLAHGSTGVALFMLYLALAANDPQFLRVGQQALAFDLSFATDTKDGGYSWSCATDETSPVYPYWRFGSAGIGKCVLRYQKLLGQQSYQQVLEKIFIDTDRKYAVLPGYFMGLAGIGDFLLDMHQFTGEERYLRSARRVAEGVMQFRVDRNGIAFPGNMLSRLSCDFGTGSAGIALFLSRVMKNQRSDFMLDSLFSFERSTLPHALRIHGIHDVVYS